MQFMWDRFYSEIARQASHSVAEYLLLSSVLQGMQVKTRGVCPPVAFGRRSSG